MKDRKNPDGITNEVLSAEYEAVFRYTLTLCRSETEAQDITQETFLRAMRSAGSFRGSSSLYTWLCSIARNLWTDRCRSQYREQPGDPNDLPAATDDFLEDRLDDRDTAMHIHRILHGIDEPYKEVFSLRVFGQLTFGDIAGLFGKTESWARVTFHRARRMICDIMRKDGYDE